MEFIKSILSSPIFWSSTVVYVAFAIKMQLDKKRLNDKLDGKIEAINSMSSTIDKLEEEMRSSSSKLILALQDRKTLLDASKAYADLSGKKVSPKERKEKLDHLNSTINRLSSAKYAS